MDCYKRFSSFLFLAFALSLKVTNGQQVPLNPVSYRIFSPFIFNPAIAGSKDFSTIDLLISNNGKFKSQVVSGDLRLSKSHKEYVSSLSAPEFTNIGIGGYLFNDHNNTSRNIGLGGTVSYHLQLDKDALSYLSFGVSAKAIFNDYSGKSDFNRPVKETFFPEFDAGLYYYNAYFFTGLSATNLLGNPDMPDSLGFYTVTVSRQLFFQVGCKFVISKSLNILLEPSLIINSDDVFSGKISDMLKPGLKLFANNFCIGTYFNDYKKISFFLQYKYPKIYLGTYFEMAQNSAFYKQPILAEFAMGLNLSAIKSGFSRENHW